MTDLRTLTRAERALDRAVELQPPCHCGLHACCDHEDYPGVPMYRLPEWVHLSHLRATR